ncbi:MAG: Two-component hybrid sensor and regulator [Pedosphaera sp.]|nr:Two-component hybrid sensor and regulator [Pedosphaera sp.]
MYRRHKKSTPSRLRRAPKAKLPPGKEVMARSQPEPAYAIVFEENPLPMCIFDGRTLALLWVNEAAIQIYGYSREEFLVMNLREIRPHEEVPRLLEFLAQAEGQSTAARSEWRHRTKDGTVFHAEVIWSRSTAFQGSDDRLVTVLHTGAINNSVTDSQAGNQLVQTAEWRRSEAVLRESQERLEAALQASGTGTFRWDFTTDLVHSDSNLDRLFGLAGVRAPHQVEVFLEKVHPEDRPLVTAAVERSKWEGADFDLDFRVRWPDQSVHWLADKGRTFLDDQGKPLYMTGACMDITPQKLAEQKLRENQDRLRLILENVKDFAIFSVDPNGSITTWNVGAERIFGYSEAEILGQNFALTFTREDRAGGEPEKELVQAHEADRSLDDRWHLHKSGKLIYMSGTVRPLADASGSLLGYIKVARDITARKQMQEQLQARLQQQAAVAHLGHLALTGGDEQALMDQTMVTVAQTLGIEFCKVLELLPGDKAMLLRAGIGWKPDQVGKAHVGTGRESQAGYTLSSDSPVISDDLHTEERFKVLELLREHHVQSSVTVVINGHAVDRPYGVLGACSTELRKFTSDDVNFLQSVANILAAALERKHVESALARSESQFRELANAMPQIVWTAGPDGEVDYFNQRWFDFTGLSPKESLAPNGWHQILHPEDLPGLLRRWSASLRSGEVYEVEGRYREHRGGGYRWQLIRAIPAKDPDGRVLRWFGSSTDVDDQKRAADSLAKAREQLRDYAEYLEKRVDERTATLRESVQSLEGVLYHVAHDLRAPLRAMQGLTTLLLEEYAPHFDAEGREYAQRIVDAASRMDVLIRDLLAYGRLGHVHLPVQRLELERLLDSILNQLSFDIAAKSAAVEVQRPLAPVRANETVLRQMLTNLLENALLYVPPGVAPRIRIWSETDAETVRLSIQDNGIGIDPEHYERIFKVFERLHRVEEYPGTGIGLAIVIKGAERMGGRVGVESEPGKGSRFWVELPREE